MAITAQSLAPRVTVIRSPTTKETMRKIDRSKDSIFKNTSTHKTISLLRESARVRDAITDMGSPPSAWERFMRQAKRELVYVAAVVWQLPAILAIWLGIAMLLYAIVF